MTDLDDIILKHLREMIGEEVDKENMVRGLATLVIQAVGRLEKLSLYVDGIGKDQSEMEQRMRRLESNSGIAHEHGDDE